MGNACQYCYDHELPHVCQMFFGVRGYCRHDKRFTDGELAMVWRGIAEDERANRHAAEWIARARGDALIRHLREKTWREACEGVKM
jgi:hypothetical protein